jgi:hypothetical protein
MMRNLILAVGAIMLLVAGAACSKIDSKPGRWNAETSTWSATVVSVNQTTRWVTLKNAEGKEFSFKVRKEVENLDKVVPGDIVDVDLIESYAVYVRKSEDYPYVQQNAVEEFGTEDGLPTKTVVETIETTAWVTAVDYKKRALTLKDASGNTFTVKVPETVTKFKNIKKGDEIVTRYTQNTVYSVRKP